MSSITWSMPATTGAITDDRYWVTSQTVIKKSITHIPQLVLPGVAFRRRISIFLPLPVAFSNEVIPIRMWINPVDDFFGANANNDEIVGHHWIYAGQNITEYEISDPVWMACVESSGTQNVVVKTATLS